MDSQSIAQRVGGLKVVTETDEPLSSPANTTFDDEVKSKEQRDTLLEAAATMAGGEMSAEAEAAAAAATPLSMLSAAAAAEVAELAKVKPPDAAAMAAAAMAAALVATKTREEEAKEQGLGSPGSSTTSRSLSPPHGSSPPTTAGTRARRKSFALGSHAPKDVASQQERGPARRRSIIDRTVERTVSPKALVQTGYVTRLTRARRRTFCEADEELVAAAQASIAAAATLSADVATIAEVNAEEKEDVAEGGDALTALPDSLTSSPTLLKGRGGLGRSFKGAAIRALYTKGTAADESAVAPIVSPTSQKKRVLPLRGISLTALDNALLLAHDGMRVFRKTGAGFAKILRPGNTSHISAPHNCAIFGPPPAPHCGVTAVVEATQFRDAAIEERGRTIKAAVWDNVFISRQVLQKLKETKQLEKMPAHINRKRTFIKKYPDINNPSIQAMARPLFRWDDRDGDGYVGMDDVNLVLADELVRAYDRAEWTELCKTADWGDIDPTRGFDKKSYEAYALRTEDWYNALGHITDRRDRFLAAKTWSASEAADREAREIALGGRDGDPGCIGKVTEFIPGPSEEGYDDIYVVETITPDKVNASFLKLPLLGWRADDWPERYLCTRSADLAWQRGDQHRRPDFVWPALGSRHLKLHLNETQFHRYTDYTTVDDVTKLIFAPHSLPRTQGMLPTSFCDFLEPEANSPNELKKAANAAAAALEEATAGGGFLMAAALPAAVTAAPSRVYNHVGRATHFVAHSTRVPFNTLVEGLGLFGDHDVEHSATYRYWISATSVNQNTAANREFKRGSFWTDGIKSVVEQIGHTLMMMSPWRTPGALGRAWCTYEMAVTLNSKMPVTFFVSPWDYLDMMSNIGDVWTHMMGVIEGIKFADGEGTRVDRKQFLSYEREHGTGATLRLLRERTRMYALQMLREALSERDHGEFDEGTIVLLDRLAHELLATAATKRKYALWVENQRVRLIELKETVIARRNQRLEMVHDRTPETKLAIETMVTAEKEAEEEITKLEKEAQSRKEEAEAEAVFAHVEKKAAGGGESSDNEELLGDSKGNLKVFLRRASMSSGGQQAAAMAAAAKSALVSIAQGTAAAAAEDGDSLKPLGGGPKKKRNKRRERKKRSVLGLKKAENLPDTQQASEAEKLLRRVILARTELHGPEHLDTLRSLQTLAVLLGELKHNVEAENLFRRAMEGRIQLHGMKDVDTLDSIKCLAQLLEKLGRTGEATEYFGAIFNVMKDKNGVESTVARTAALDVCRVLRIDERFAEAEILWREVLMAAEMAQKVGTGNATTVADTKVQLAITLADQDKLDEAVSLRREALQTFEKSFGDLHERSIEAASQLAALLKDRGDLHEAHHQYMIAVKGYELTLGEMSRQALTCKFSMGTVLKRLGRLRLAEPVFRSCAVGFRSILGGQHAQTIAALSLLASTLHQLGRFAEAEPHLRRILTGREMVLGKSHVATLTVCNNLASLLEDREKFEEAEKLRRRVLDGITASRDDFDREVMMARSNFAICLVKQQKWRIAEEPSKTAYEHLKAQFGVSDPATMNSSANYVIVLRKLKKYETAEQLTREVLKIETEQKGLSHTDTLYMMNTLGDLMRDQRRTADAVGLYRRAMDGFLAISQGSLEDGRALLAAQNLAQVLTAQGTQKEMREASQLHTKVLAASKAIFGEKHARTAHALKSHAYHMRANRRYKEATTLLRESQMVFFAAQGANSISRLGVLYTLAKLEIKLGRLVSATANLRIALGGYKSTLGAQSDQALKVTSILGAVLTWQGGLDEAQALLVPALEQRRSSLGPAHGQTVRLQLNLARLRIAQGDLRTAHILMNQARLSRVASLGREHPKTLIAILLQSGVLLGLGRLEEAHDLAEFAYDEFVKEVGSTDSRSLLAGHTLACVLIQRGRISKAEKLLRECRDRSEIGHTASFVGTFLLPDEVSITSTLAMLLHMRGNVEMKRRWSNKDELNPKLLADRMHTEAERMYLHVLHTLEAAVGAADAMVVMSTMNLAQLEMDRREPAKAIKLLRRAISVNETVRGKTDIVTFAACTKLAMALSAEGHADEAELYATRASRGLEEIVGLTNPQALWASGVVGLVNMPRGKQWAKDASDQIISSYLALVQPKFALSESHGWLPTLKAPIGRRLRARQRGSRSPQKADVDDDIYAGSKTPTTATDKAELKELLATYSPKSPREGDRSRRNSSIRPGSGTPRLTSPRVRRGSTVRLDAERARAEMAMQLGRARSPNPPASPMSPSLSSPGRTGRRNSRRRGSTDSLRLAASSLKQNIAAKLVEKIPAETTQGLGTKGAPKKPALSSSSDETLPAMSAPHHHCRDSGLVEVAVIHAPELAGQLEQPNVVAPSVLRSPQLTTSAGWWDHLGVAMGMTVNHPTRGFGTVVAISPDDDSRVHVQFLVKSEGLHRYHEISWHKFFYRRATSPKQLGPVPLPTLRCETSLPSELPAAAPPQQGRADEVTRRRSHQPDAEELKW